MSSYLKLFQDFLQKKELVPDKRRKSSVSETEDEDESEALPASAADSTASISPDNNNISSNKMEHSYTRDGPRPISELLTGLSPARTILVRRPPQCPSCHTHPLDESDLDDGNQALVPGINEIKAKEAMVECGNIANDVKNNNSDDHDWESRINQNGWTNMQRTLFAKVVRILDSDQLGRLVGAGAGRTSESVQRRALVDKSASRMRKTLASVAWDARLTQWLHSLLMDYLPSTYMATYLDILQTLKAKLPSLMDKMFFGRPISASQELLAPVLKGQWEPMVIAKSRKLTQNAVIVALPSLPSSGQLPTRMQKWYKSLESITAFVQVTLPSASGQLTRQPFEAIAEQIVSLTRVKIQELRNENSSRSIILIGFNAGAALALQVAMSENIACVVCMGFAYNTLNGARGAPDDRILDIKLPILFVVGQNSARSSREEIESLREKMQSESSLVVVGCADDELRVPKSRRKIESVTQSMVDSMVVDEVYDFIKKTLNNPPGPRIPTTISSAVKQNKQNAALLAGGGDGKLLPLQQRKRKQDTISGNSSSTVDPELTPPATKTKYVAHSKLNEVGRPRTRPLNTPTSTPAKTTQIMTTSTPISIGSKLLQKSTPLSAHAITNEDLNLAIQSILGDPNDPDAATSTIKDSQKLVTNFELVAQSKSTPIKTSLINPLKQHTTIIGASNATTGTTAQGIKIKMIPANQFVQLKPPLQSQSKIYTIKTSAMQGGGTNLNLSNLGNLGNTSASIGSIVATPTIASSSAAAATAPVQQQIFTLKSPNGQTTQFVTAAPAAAQRKYTVVKNATGGTTLQLTTPASTAAKVVGGGVGGLDLSNIIDMPIIFADSDGNLSDVTAGTSSMDPNKTLISAASLKPSTSSGVGQLIISQKILKEASAIGAGTPTKPGTYMINKPGTTIIQQTTPQTIVASGGVANKPNKVVFINRNTMKPCPNIISRSNVAQQLPKYTKVVVTNPKTAATTLVPRPGTQIISAVSSSAVGSGGSSSPIVTTVKTLNLQALKTVSAASVASTSTSSSAGSIINMPTKSLQQFQIINSSVVASSLDKSSLSSSSAPQIRNIVVKPGGLKQIPPHLKTQLLNRNLTVRKLVNIVPATQTTVSPTSSVSIVSSTASQLEALVSAASGSASTSAAAAGAMQTAPKIITLNPINPSQSKAD